MNWSWPLCRSPAAGFDRSRDAAKAIVYELNGDILTRDEFAALDPASQAMATCHADITLPPGFMPGDDLNAIDTFGAPYFGEDAELGYSINPYYEWTQGRSYRLNVHVSF